MYIIIHQIYLRKRFRVKCTQSKLGIKKTGGGDPSFFLCFFPNAYTKKVVYYTKKIVSLY
jgi:hypothetical protein